MSASDHLNQAQFMPVHELMNMHSHEALRLERQRAAGKPDMPWPTHGPTTRFRNSDLYLRKLHDVNSIPLYRQLDEPIRNGTIDPVVLQRSHEPSGGEEIFEGHHRIVQAHQLGVERLPVDRSGGWDSQKHYDEWNPEDE